ncbi:MAG TPA: MBL fold metallo-hydrolase [Steroidobacteraceae bacterium]|jgi:glyoxylase-like metal-dependent hydrolase (beta-lactamase superfamily II)
MSTFARAILGVFLVMGVIDAQAQQPAVVAPIPDFSKVEIKTTRLASDFYTLEGQGGTISVLTGPDGVFLVDSQFAPLTDRLVAAIRKISDKPIRFLVNTHVHGDHTGGNENFAKRGVLIFSRDQLRARLQHPAPGPDGSPGKPAPAGALPVVTYDGPVTIHLNGEDVHLIPIRAAHTDGDTLISFSAHDILAVGDYFRSIGYPYVDLVNGGSLSGLLAGLGETIGRAGPTTKIIPGHGPIVDRAALIANRDMVLAVRDRVAALISQGKSVDEVIAAKPTAAYDATITQGAQTADRFIRWLYAEVKAARQ